jgi:hypothetical protein
MIGLDTNVLVRYLVEDDDPQKRAADRFVEEALNRGESLSNDAEGSGACAEIAPTGIETQNLLLHMNRRQGRRKRGRVKTWYSEIEAFII